ncbi:hypothetical protein LCGC14_0063230 [marine sediment metagenome]
MDAARASVPVPLGELLEDRRPAWRAVRLQGTYDPEHVWLLDNRTRAGHAGVEVLQPFLDNATGQWVIVNRGWLAWPDRREALVIEAPSQPLQLDAEVMPVAGEAFTLGTATIREGWPKLITSIDAESMKDQAQIVGPVWTTRLRSGSPSAYVLDWPALPTTASKHIGYAVQWFALAAALLILFIWAGLRPELTEDEQIEHDRT